MMLLEKFHSLLIRFLHRVLLLAYHLKFGVFLRFNLFHWNNSQTF